MQTKTKKYTTTFITLVICIFMLMGNVNAQVLNVITAQDANIDTSKTRDDTNYNLQSKVIVIPIYPFTDEVGLSSQEMYRGLYFYTVEVLGFNDIPFHYLVSEDGKIFKGNKGGEERKIRINGIGDDMVLIGYMTNRSAGRFSQKSKTALTNIITEVVNKNNINPDNISIEGMKFVRNQTTRTVSIEQDSIFGNWATSMDEIKNAVKPRFSPTPKDYKANVDSVEVPTTSINPGDEVTISLNITNKGSNGMYGGTNSEIILTKVGDNLSKFFFNNEWLSTTQVGVMTPGEILLPFQAGKFDFKAKAPLFVGDVEEEFELKTVDGRKIDAPNIKVKLTMGQPTRQIAEVNDRVTFVTSIFESPAASSAEVAEGSPGQRFFVVSESGNGWVEVELSDGRRGWIQVWLLNFL